MNLRMNANMLYERINMEGAFETFSREACEKILEILPDNDLFNPGVIEMTFEEFDFHRIIVEELEYTEEQFFLMSTGTRINRSLSWLVTFAKENSLQYYILMKKDNSISDYFSISSFLLFNRANYLLVRPQENATDF